MRILITRPREDAGPLAEKIRRLGHEPVVAPLLRIVVREDVVVPELKYQAICVSSANGIRAAAGKVDVSHKVFAVGKTSAETARAFGFAQVFAAGGDVNALAGLIANSLSPSNGPLLYLSGAETSGDLEGQLRRLGFDVMRLIAYDAVATQWREMPSCDAVLHYSARSAKLWLLQASRLGYATSAVTHYCLSSQVAAQLPRGLRLSVANSPNESSLLGLLENNGKAA